MWYDATFTMKAGIYFMDDGDLISWENQMQVEI